jgi:hypothetical protein
MKRCQGQAVSTGSQCRKLVAIGSLCSVHNKTDHLSVQPQNVVENIVRYLDPKSMVRFSRSNRRLRSLISPLIRVYEMTQQKECEAMDHIPLPIGFDEDTDKYIFDWDLPKSPNWDEMMINPRQILVWRTGPIIISLPTPDQLLLITLQGPINLRRFVEEVNRVYQDYMNENNLTHISEVLGDHVYPEDLMRIGETIYELMFGN